MGETGSGKTTQLPQFIQDARLINGQIGVTQVSSIKRAPKSAFKYA